MSDGLDLEGIRRYWQQQAVTFGGSVAASWSDRYAVELEIAAITSRLIHGAVVLDAGCANGFSTMRFAAARRVAIQAIDLVPEMIENARRRYEEERASFMGTIEFGVGDVRDLMFAADSFDAVVCVRVVINLGDWEGQRRALHELVRVLRPGGTLLLSEATVQGWQRLNALRAEWGLAHIPMPAFNRYLDQDRVIAELTAQAELVEVANFASTYFVGTRVLKPLLIAAAKAPLNVADPDTEWNRFCAQLPAWGDYGTQKLFVFQKR